MLARFLERVSYCKELAELSHMNVESGVVVPRHQPFDFVGVKDFLIFQRGQIPGTQANGNSGRGTPFQLMKTSFPNKPGKHQRMNMGMEVEQAAVGLQEFTKVFMPGLPCLAQQLFKLLGIIVNSIRLSSKFYLT